MAVTRDPELERFKVEIDLRAFAAGQGYAWDKKESWRGSCVMRHADGDKIVIKRDADGHYVYFSVRSDSDNGSVIDFCLNRQGLNLGQVRQALRPWVKHSSDQTSGTAKLPAFPELEKTAKDRMEVERAYQLMADAPRHPYLENSRGLSPALLGSERFAGRVKIDGNGNAVFPHFDEAGLCGFEMKNREYTGFSKGGAKGLWFSRGRKDDTRLVFCESAIDALSHATLFPAPLTARYASIGGQMNPRQPELIRMAIGRLPGASEVVAAMDADPQGQKLSALILEAVARVAKETSRVDLGFSTQQPIGFKDWNDQLRASQASSFPAGLS